MLHSCVKFPPKEVVLLASLICRIFDCVQIEFEHFQQISEIIENNLTRNQYLVELIIPMNQNISLNLNYEEEDYIIKSRSKAFSLTMAIEWKGRIRLKK